MKLVDLFKDYFQINLFFT